MTQTDTQTITNIERGGGMSTKINDGGPAFPMAFSNQGMTLRDWFAGQALGAQVADAAAFNDRSRARKSDIRITDEDVANACWSYADAMMKAREKEGATRPRA